MKIKQVHLCATSSSVTNKYGRPDITVRLLSVGNKRWRIQKGQSKMDNTEKLVTQDKTIKAKTQYVLDTTMYKYHPGCQ